MSETVTRMPPNIIHEPDIHQGWALRCHPPGPAMDRPVDLLFVHGMAAGAWMWPEEWLAAFTGAGYRCWTMTLPGRDGGATLGTDPNALDRVLASLLEGGDPVQAAEALYRALPGMSLFDGPDLDDFTTALEDAIAQIGRPVVPVAHSLGGAVVQNALRRGIARPAGNVLMCSAPPYGLWRAGIEMAWTNPDLWQTLIDFSLFGVANTDLNVMRRNLFPGGISDRDYAKIVALLRDESLAAMIRANGFPPFAPLPGWRNDVLVIGGARDRFVPAWDVHMTGLYYGCGATIVPDGGHMLMHEPAAGDAVMAILGWLTDQTEMHARAA